MEPIGSTAGPREVLARFRRAAVGQSVDDLRRVYAPDAVHEFPFVRPGVPSRLTGRDEIVGWISAGWRTLPLRYERYRTIAVHDTGEPATIVVEQEAIGRNASTGRDFVLPNIVVLTVHGGRITRLRDYVNVLAAADAAGRPIDG
ncbi:MAG TPA: nuclear transport factor 2 family protein [Actinocatenispora sp.]